MTRLSYVMVVALCSEDPSAKVYIEHDEDLRTVIRTVLSQPPSQAIAEWCWHNIEVGFYDRYVGEHELRYGDIVVLRYDLQAVQ